MAGAPHLEQFILAAKSFIGLRESGYNTFNDARGDELMSLWGSDFSGTSWCAIFISACAQKAGICNILIEKTSMAGWIQEGTVLHYNGQWIEGPMMNGYHAVTPMTGDILSLGNADCYGYGHATHVGIVLEVKNGKVHTIEGNTNEGEGTIDGVYDKWRDLDADNINMYVRPDWAAVGDDVSAYSLGVSGSRGGPLYSIRNDRHDMTLRQVGYLDNHYKFTNDETGIAISVINYTSLLADMYDMYSRNVYGDATVDTSNLSGNEKIVMDMLLDYGFRASSASAVTGCLKVYSNISPAASYKTPSGNTMLCGLGMWEGDKLQELKDRLGYGWNINLSGQVEFLLYDLEKNYRELLNSILVRLSTKEEVKKVAIEFICKYNIHFILQSYIDEAIKYGLEIFDKLIITYDSLGGGKNMVDIDGQPLTPQKTIQIPQGIGQAGIDGNFTSYSFYYHKWAAGTVQRQLADIWAYSGFPYDRGSIALVGGYYCVAVAPTFGDAGDVILVTLENGTSFAAIIADTKNEADKYYCEWGHIYEENGLINVIEWERIVTYDGEVQTLGSSGTIVDSIDLSGWAGLDVASITNYGSYL